MSFNDYLRIMRATLLGIMFFLCFNIDSYAGQHGLANGDLEGWRKGQFRCCGRNVDTPFDWGTPEQSCGINFNKFVFLEENSYNVHSGRYSAMLFSDTTFFNSVVLQPGMLVYGGYQDPLDSVIRIGQPVPQYGLPIDSNPVQLDFWLMMSHDLADTFSYMYLFTKWDSLSHREDTLAFSTVDVPDTHIMSDLWFEVKDSIHYIRAGQADTVKMIFYGGRFGNPALAGNITWIDDIRLLYEGEDTTTSVNTSIATQTAESCAIYPNPVSDILNVQVSNYRSGVDFYLIDDLGRTVLKVKLNQNQIHLDVSPMSPGAYIGRLSDDDGNLMYQQKIVIAR